MKTIRIHIPIGSLDEFKRTASEYKVTTKSEQDLGNGLIGLLVEVEDPYELFIMGKIANINQELHVLDTLICKD